MVSIDNIDLIEATNIDGSIDEFKLKYMDIRFSNLCNFKCRSCGPGCSNLHGEEKLQMIEEHVFITRFGNENDKKAKTLISNNEGGTFMDKLRPYLDDVEECYFAGGEILVTPGTHVLFHLHLHLLLLDGDAHGPCNIIISAPLLGNVVVSSRSTRLIGIRRNCNK